MKAPSAELRPNQKDSDTLPDYEIIDEVIEAYMEKHMTSEAIAQKMKLAPSFVATLIQKLHHAEFKRRQTPLGLKVSLKAFSIGWRSPIVQKWSE
jgi:NAD+ synthase (glutamine-hydrolysing)